MLWIRLQLYIAYIVVNGLWSHMTTSNVGVIIIIKQAAELTKLVLTDRSVIAGLETKFLISWDVVKLGIYQEIQPITWNLYRFKNSKIPLPAWRSPSVHRIHPPTHPLSYSTAFVRVLLPAYMHLPATPVLSNWPRSDHVSIQRYYYDRQDTHKSKCKELY